MQINGYRSLTDALNGTHNAAALGAVNKMFWSEYHRETMELAISILGLEGQILTGSGRRTTTADEDGPLGRRGSPGYPVSTLQASYFFSVSETIWGGTAEIQRNIVGERVLGLPKEPKPDQRLTASGVGGQSELGTPSSATPSSARCVSTSSASRHLGLELCLAVAGDPGLLAPAATDVDRRTSADRRHRSDRRAPPSGSPPGRSIRPAAHRGGRCPRKPIAYSAITRPRMASGRPASGWWSWPWR